MTRTSLRVVIVALIVGVTIGYLLNVVIVSRGGAMLVPPLTLPLTLSAMAVMVIAFAWPVRQTVRGAAKKRVNPLVASRTAMLAKASSLAGALLSGFSAGIVYFTLTRAATAPGSVTGATIAAVIGGLILLAAGLVAEHFCSLPPDDPEDDGGAPTPPQPSGSSHV